MTMRVLVVTNMYPPHHYGGYELSCRDTVRRFERQGHEISVLTSNIRVAGVDATDDPGPQVRRELEIYWRDHELLRPSVRRRLAMERRSQQALLRALAEVRPHVVSVWNMGALSLGLLTTLGRRGIPTVHVVGDEWPVYAPHLDPWSRLFRGPFGRRAGGAVEAFAGVPTAPTDFTLNGPCLFVSECMRRVSRDASSWRLPDTAVVSPGVDPEDFPVGMPSAPVADRPWRGRLLYVGRIDERKGIDTAVRALTLLPEARLRIVGRGDDTYRDRLQRLAEDLGVAARTEFAAVERARLRDEYRSADALVFTSVYREPFGIVPLEAMACDTPVLATGTGGSGEYLCDGDNCLLFGAGDHRRLAAATRRLAGDPGLRGRLLAGGRRTAERLTSDAYAAALLRWHEAAAGRRTSARPVASPAP